MRGRDPGPSLGVKEPPDVRRSSILTNVRSTSSASCGLGWLTPQPPWPGIVPIYLCLGGFAENWSVVYGTPWSPCAWRG